MKQLKTIGTKDPAIAYAERTAVKVVIRRGDDLLVLNKGLLPGGDVQPGETNIQAIERELREGFGSTVTNIQEIGEVVQYREFIQTKYIIQGYSVELEDVTTTPPSQGEAQPHYQWMTKEDAVEYVSKSIATVERVVMLGDAIQGRLYDLKTSLKLVKNS